MILLPGETRLRRRPLREMCGPRHRSGDRQRRLSRDRPPHPRASDHPGQAAL